MKADSSRMVAAIGARQYLHKARGGNSSHGGAGVAVILMFAVMSGCMCMPRVTAVNCVVLKLHNVCKTKKEHNCTDNEKGSGMTYNELR